MNKSIFRAIRRECKAMFDQFIKSHKYTNSRSKRIFKANLRRFAAYLLGIHEYKQTDDLGVDLNSFMVHAGVLVNNCLMKKIFDGEDCEIEKIKEFNELLFLYSHKRFNDFVKKKEVGKLVKIVIEKCTIEKLVGNNLTLNTNSESYTAHIQNMLVNL